MVILAIGVDSSFLASKRPVWQSAGCYVTAVESIREAIDRFQGGDFDLILLGSSISVESRERLTFLVRASGSQIPVVCFAESCNDRADLLHVIGELLAKTVRTNTAAQAGEAG